MNGMNRGMSSQILTPKTSGIIPCITIDGIINETAWESIDHKVQFYINADPSNADGYNFMYIRQDVNNLYIALDLCSDISNDTNGEWVSVWLITENRTFDATDGSEWASYKNNGTETFTYNVEENRIWNFTGDGAQNSYIGTECRTNTLNNVEIAWTFSFSSNNATAHRIFEISIPKSEIEHYNSSGYLGLLVGGYGTMSFDNNDHWQQPEYRSDFSEHDSSLYDYYNMTGLSIPFLCFGPGDNIPGYDFYMLLGVIGVSSAVLIIIKKSRKDIIQI